MSNNGMLQHELKLVREQRDGLQAALDASERECQRLRERLATTDRARQLALADLTAAEMHLDAAGLPIPSLPQPSEEFDAQWAILIGVELHTLWSATQTGQTLIASLTAPRIDALVREWPARRERLLSGGGDG